MQKLPTPVTPTAPVTPAQAAVPLPTMIINGTDVGQIPSSATEVYADWSADPMPVSGLCGVLISTNGTPEGAEFVEGEVPITPSDFPVNIHVDTIANAPRCSPGARVELECRAGVLTVVVYDSDDVELAARDMSDVLIPIDLVINGVTVGTVSRCATSIAVDVEGTCIYNEVIMDCESSGAVSVDDGLGGSYSAPFTC